MVNSKDFGKRIQKVMDHYAVSASSFADYMGVGRSSISHILSGRNKPSLDFVMKIVDAYNEVDLHWLLYGKGAFPNSESDTIEEEKSAQENLITKNQSPSSVLPSEQDLFSQSLTTEKETIQPHATATEKNSQMPSGAHEIDRIVVFYSDGTFNSYQMKKS